METALETVLINLNKAGMISYIETHPEAFKEAVELAVSDKHPYAWRAAWLLWSCLNKNDKRIRGHIQNIIGVLPSKDIDHQRELLKILLLMELDEGAEGVLYNHCLSIWEKISNKPSVRFTAFNMIVKIAKEQPELSREIPFLTQGQYMNTLSPAAKKSILNRVHRLIGA